MSKPTLNEKFIAYLALFSGLAISVVAEYYSILGLTAIFAAASFAVIVMGIALGVGKITATLWLKQNWGIAHWSMRAYLLTAIVVLMGVTSMGIFGFLSKAHSDQSLVSGDVLAKISVFDEKIKTAKENIDVNRKALKQLDEAVDQTMGRTASETGAEKAVAIRRSQQKERARLLSEIQAEQATITKLSEERAPIAAEVRKVEAEVGPIKYIAAFVYGETSGDILEKAVTWVIILLIVVFDPLAVILLLSSQISFQNFRDRERDVNDSFRLGPTEYIPDPEEDLLYAPNVGEKPTADELKDDLFPTYEEITPTEGDSPEKESDVVSTATVTEPIVAQEVTAVMPEAFVEEPAVEKNDEPVRTVITGNRTQPKTRIFKQSQKMLTDVTEEAVQELLQEPPMHSVTNMGNGYIQVDGQMYHEGSIPPHIQGYIQNEEQRESGVWSRVKKDEEQNNSHNPT